MANKTESGNRKSSVTFEVLLGIVLLICGCAIYLLFRSKSLNIYIWCSTLGQSHIIDIARTYAIDWIVPDVIKFCLPDGLYVSAYLLIMDAIWQKEDSLIKHIVICLVPVFAITSEVLQYYGVVKGTFDICDLLFYSAPFITYYIYKYHSFKFNKLKIKRL